MIMDKMDDMTPIEQKTAGKKKKRKNTTGRDPKTGKFTEGNSFAEKWNEDRAMRLAKELIAWMKEDNGNFWLEDFLFEKDLYPDLIGRLSERFPPFAEHIAHAKKIQESRIKKFALMNQLNSGMAQWVLATVHDIHNVAKTETEVKSSQPLVVHIDERAAKEE